MKQLTRLLGSTTLAIIMTSSAFAADAITDPEASVNPGDFDTSRFYISAFGGVVFQDDTDLAGIVNGGPESVELDFDTGFTVGGAIGYSFGDVIGNGLLLRGELEVSYSERDIDDIFFSGNGPAAEINVNGDFSTTNVVINGLVDIPQWGNELFTPYVGAGVGIAFSDLDASYGPGVRLNEDEENVIAQAIVGATFTATETTDLFVEGRYSRIFDFETPRFAPNGALTGNIEDDVDSYGINFGLRFKL